MKHILLVTGKAIATLLLVTQVFAQEKAEENETPNLVELRYLIRQGLFRIYKEHYGYQQDIDGKVSVINFASDPELFKEFPATDFVQAGCVAADGMAALIKKEFGKAEGDIALITSVPATDLLEQRNKGFQEQVSAKYPDMKLVTYKEVADGHATPAWSTMTDLIKSTPKLRGVFASNPIVAEGAAQALADNNAIDKIILVGSDSKNKPVKLVKRQTQLNSYTIRWQSKGDTASGVVVERGATTISLDVTPCATEKEIVTFVKPYKESPINNVDCGQNKVYQQSQVIQQ
jgi:Periplasmic binding protein domain